MIASLKSFLRRGGVNVCSTDRLGVDVEVDLARLEKEEPLQTIFDVGANFGQSAIKFARAFPRATVLSFEPVPDSFRELKVRTAERRNIQVHNIGFGDEAGLFDMQIQADSQGNSLASKSSSRCSIEVRLETVDAFANNNEIDQIDLLKIDVEGFELQVLKGAAGMLRAGAVRHIFAECVFAPDSDYPHTDFFDLHRVLSEFGFCIVAIYGQSFRLADGCALGNVLFSLRSRLPSVALGKIRNIY